MLEGDSIEGATTKGAVGLGVGLIGDAVGISTGAQVGAMLGTLIPIPGVGTLLGAGIGAAVGFGISYFGSMVTDVVIDRYWDDSIGQASKDLQSVGNAIAGVANNVGNAITSVIPTLPKLGWW